MAQINAVYSHKKPADAWRARFEMELAAKDAAHCGCSPEWRAAQDLVVFTGDFNCGSNQDTIKKLAAVPWNMTIVIVANLHLLFRACPSTTPEAFELDVRSLCLLHVLGCVANGIIAAQLLLHKATDTSYNGADHIFSSGGVNILWKGSSTSAAKRCSRLGGFRGLEAPGNFDRRSCLGPYLF